MKTKSSGSDILTFEHEYFDYLNPRPETINIRDIAHALSNICRFTGHCREFYSVAQHSVECSYIVPEEHAFAALMHDAAEAYLGDVASPLKRLLPDFKRLERRIESVVFPHYGLTGLMPQCVKIADLVMLKTEQRDLMHAGHHEWNLPEGIEPLPRILEPLEPANAKLLFLERFSELYYPVPVES